MLQQCNMDEKLIEVGSPGVILKKQFLGPSGITVYRLVDQTGFGKMNLSDILKGTHKITSCFRD